MNKESLALLSLFDSKSGLVVVGTLFSFVEVEDYVCNIFPEWHEEKEQSFFKKLLLKEVELDLCYGLDKKIIVSPFYLIQLRDDTMMNLCVRFLSWLININTR